jgi:hypothetical protein
LSVRRALAVLTAALGACGSEADTARPDPPERLALEPTLTIGSLDGPDALGEVIGVFEAPNGDVYVTQFNDAAVQVFDSGGRLVREPTEFMFPGPVGMRGDSLWIADGMAGRVTLFAPGGAMARVVTINRPVDGIDRCQIRAGSYLPDGRLWVRPQCPTLFLIGGEIDALPVLRITERGETVDTIALIPPAPQMVQVRQESGTASLVIPAIGAAPFAVAPASDVFVGIDGAAGAIRAWWLDADGDTIGGRRGTRSAGRSGRLTSARSPRRGYRRNSNSSPSERRTSGECVGTTWMCPASFGTPSESFPSPLKLSAEVLPHHHITAS